LDNQEMSANKPVSPGRVKERECKRPFKLKLQCTTPSGNDSPGMYLNNQIM